MVNVNCESTYDSLTNKIVYSEVDEMPEYPNGNGFIGSFFLKNFNYPAQDFYQASFQLEFIVDINGNVIGQRIRNKSMKDLTNAEREALRVLSIMPKWKPGKCNGRVVPVRTFLPLRL